MELNKPSLMECLDVLKWRKKCPEALRTTHEITEYEQTLFWVECVHSHEVPNPKHLYWSASNDINAVGRNHVAFGGLTYIDWVNLNAEISLIVAPYHQDKGYGKKVVKLLLDKAKEIGLNMVYGECYMCNKNLKFWQEMADNYVILPRRKLWDRIFYDSLYFTFFLEKLNGSALHS